MKGTASYSYSTSQQEENLKRRHWQVQTVGPPSSRKVSPEQVGQQALNEVNARRGLYSLYRLGGGGEEGAEFWKTCLTRPVLMEHGEEFLQKVKEAWETQIDGGLDAIAAKLAEESAQKELAEEAESKKGEAAKGESENVSVSSSKGSRTARMTADARRTADALGFGPDFLAKHFIFNTKELDEILAAKAEDFKRFGVVPGTGEKLMEQVEQMPFLPMCLTTYLQNRTCFLDDTIAAFTSQFSETDHNVVVLGAGFDTRFYRLELPAKAKKFEIDAGRTQEVKLKELRESGVSLPSDVAYVKCDFVAQDWFEVLKDAGCDTTLPTLVIWEGVTMYLPEDVIRSTLKRVAESFTGAAAISFDYYSPRLIKMFAANMKKSGEALHFGAEPEEMVALVEELGLQVIDHLRNRQCSEERYMPINASTGKAVGVAGDHEFFLTACNKRF